jgi:hypothetical protein
VNLRETDRERYRGDEKEGYSFVMKYEAVKNTLGLLPAIVRWSDGKPPAYTDPVSRMWLGIRPSYLRIPSRLIKSR